MRLWRLPERDHVSTPIFGLGACRHFGARFVAFQQPAFRILASILLVLIFDAQPDAEL
jgi:hypothetical protein